MPRARKAYANRTDLQAPKVTATPIPGQAYGEQAAQTAAERVAPLGAQPQPQAPARPLAPRPATPGPGELPFLEPSNRPDEPVTHGLPFGPGAGPEVMNQGAPPLVRRQLAQAALDSGSETLANLASFAQSMGL